MRRRLPRFSAAVAVTGVLALTGCSDGGGEGAQPSSTQTSPQATASTTTTAARTAAPGEVGTSPGGVTTAVGAPAESTEEEYFQACDAAKTWMNERGGDLKAQVEPYLAEIQKSDAAGPGTFGTPWSQLQPARQAAVIVAVEAAADGLCG
ncbi:lipoprotein LpqV [Mycolicibacterium baixiangningiae]|uniref:lipoprotein LpqV n=1 Tax=Mycolicibacterium baixiangningiae TaxID=2761578 RepID=UPI001868F29A|nr:lipoprotein LpqV [Mycolicibacterium baixiangningiae]